MSYYADAAKNRWPSGALVDETSSRRGRAVEQWFLVAIGDDEKVKERISQTAKERSC
jgi:hypothetical protein